MARLDNDPSVVVIVIEGTDGSFCAGADMAEMLAAEEAVEPMVVLGELVDLELVQVMQ